jgi:hypothetical protein
LLSSEKISEYRNGNRVAQVFKSGRAYAVHFIEVNSETMNEILCTTLETAEIKAEDWVLNK